MTYALIHIINPENFESFSAEKSWRDNLAYIVSTAKLPPDCKQRLADNVVELRLDTDMLQLSSCLSQLDASNIKYRIAFFEHPLQWITRQKTKP